MITFARRSLARVVKSAKAPPKAAEKGLDINTEAELIKFLNDEGIPVSLNVGKVVEIGNTEMSKVAERKLKKMKRDESKLEVVAEIKAEVIPASDFEKQILKNFTTGD